MNHLRRWGLLWAAGGLSLLLVGSVLWTHSGVRAHADELALVHGDYLIAKLQPVGPDAAKLEEELWRLRPYGLVALHLYGPSGDLMESVGAPRELAERVQGPIQRVGRGQVRIETTWPSGHIVVVEYRPQLLHDLQRRTNFGLALAATASLLLMLAAALWLRLRHRAEEAEKQAAKAQQMAHLGTMSAVVAHELRNPLTILLGHVQLLREDDPSNRGLVTVEQGALRLDQLVDSLLRYTRTGELAREPLDPRALLDRAVADVDMARVAVDGEADPCLLDGLQMRQVLSNLLRNALAAQTEGQVKATVGKVGAELVFTIRDHGEGVPKAMRDQIFEPFITTKTQGTGLGLAVARDIVESHGGTMALEEPEDGGARFVVKVPY